MTERIYAQAKIKGLKQKSEGSYEQCTLHGGTTQP